METSHSTNDVVACASGHPVLAYPSIDVFCASVGIGRTQAYEEIKERRLKVAKVGRRTIIPLAEAQRWLAERMADAERAA